MDVWYKIEFLVPEENAIGGKAYWTTLEDEDGHPTCIVNEATARRIFSEVRAKFEPRESIQLVRVSEEVVAGG